MIHKLSQLVYTNSPVLQCQSEAFPAGIKTALTEMAHLEASLRLDWRHLSFTRVVLTTAEAKRDDYCDRFDAELWRCQHLEVGLGSIWSCLVGQLLLIAWGCIQLSHDVYSAHDDHLRLMDENVSGPYRGPWIREVECRRQAYCNPLTACFFHTFLSQWPASFVGCCKLQLEGLQSLRTSSALSSFQVMLFCTFDIVPP